MFNITENIEIGAEQLVLLCGPCVVESYEICFEIASFMKKITAELDMSYIFKASYDKANRSSGSSFRGHGIDRNLEILSKIKKELKLPIVIDVHEVWQIERAAAIADVLQIPAFLCRQTDLIIAAAKTGRTINIKKGQFMAPEDMKGAVEKVKTSGNNKVILTERGTTFGYHNLVVDIRSLPIMRSLGVPVIFDGTHSVQLPGALGKSSGGQKEFVETLVLSSVAAGIDGLFLEIHPNPENALSDGANSLDFKQTENLLRKVKYLYEIQRKGFKY
ncbi:MAG TPA: 3-deoxy-8-phosphooctulonate synthase [Lentisphaeria bacterium]|nr:MAG: 3-deoxy-8-phosphooctulonate synthase [Lentisphaerae bacterium GWF2_38_69]HBM15528.1 3-deoxy-8-phosphooctulonate synthase [Lentisphaeria bacterium]